MAHIAKFQRTIKTMAKFTVLLTHDNIPQPAIDLLESKCDLIQLKRDATHEDLLSYAGKVDALFVFGHWVIGKEFADKSNGRLKVVANMGVGVDHLDVGYLKSHDIKVSNTTGTLDNSVSEVALCLALSVGHRMKEGFEIMKTGTWGKGDPQWLLGQEITGSTVGIIGLGNIGKAIVKRVKPFEPGRVIYSGRSRKPYDTEIGTEFVPFETLLKESDFIFISCPSTPETKSMINKSTINLMKKNSIIINVSRGDLINQDDLYSALKNNQIWGAGLDVMTPEPIQKDNPILSLRNCVLSPHIGSATSRARIAMAELTAKNILAALQGEKMPTPL